MVFTLTKPSAIFLATVPEIHVLNEELVRANEVGRRPSVPAWLSKNDAGSGSFKLTPVRPGGGMGRRSGSMTTSSGWDTVDDPLDVIEFRTVVEINSRVLGLMNGDFHANRRLPAPGSGQAAGGERECQRRRAGIDADLLFDHPQRPLAR